MNPQSLGSESTAVASRGAGADSVAVADRVRPDAAASRPEVIAMRDVCKSYVMGDDEVEVLHHVNLRVREGEFVSILGPSGSGKSTLMNILGCLDVPTSGSYVLAGNDVGNLSETELAHIRNSEVGFVFQSFQLLPRLSALENVELPLIYSSASSAERRRRALKLLDQVGLSDKTHHLPNQLSGGQQQRVAIARALVTEPSVLLADEPTGALDQKTGEQVMDLFGEIHRDGRTVIMITHENDIARHAKRIVKILDGFLTEHDQ
ncbi:MAG: ABC transporter ATP-binding protein [Propionicimonas sp.]